MSISRVGAAPATSVQENVPSLANSHVSQVARRALRRQREEEGNLPRRVRHRPDPTLGKKRKTPDFEEKFPLDRIVKKRPGLVSSAEKVITQVDLETTPFLPDSYRSALLATLQEYENPFFFPKIEARPPFLPSFPKNEEYQFNPKKAFSVDGLADDYYTYGGAYSKSTDRLAVAVQLRAGFQIYIINFKSKEMIHLFPSDRLYDLNHRPVSLLFTPKGGGLIVATHRGAIEIWSLGKEGCRKEWEIHPPKEARSRLPWLRTVMTTRLIALATVLDKKLLAGDAVGTLYQIDQATKRVERIVSFGKSMGQILKIAVSPNGTYIAVAGGQGEVAVLNSRTFDTVHRFSVAQQSIKAVAFAPDDSNWIAVGGGDQDPSIHISRFLSVDPSVQKIIRIAVEQQVTNILWPEKDTLISTHRGGIRAIPLALDNEKFAPHGKPILTDLGEKRVIFADIRHTEDGKRELLYTAGETLAICPFPTKKNMNPSDKI